uniref:Putative secreted protein n=1 Tax=Amblyomma triste TaxID=251400 RepID=A0A023G0S9_AMBTT
MQHQLMPAVSACLLCLKLSGRSSVTLLLFTFSFALTTFKLSVAVSPKALPIMTQGYVKLSHFGNTSSLEPISWMGFV